MRAWKESTRHAKPTLETAGCWLPLTPSTRRVLLDNVMNRAVAYTRMLQDKTMRRTVVYTRVDENSQAANADSTLVQLLRGIT